MGIIQAVLGPLPALPPPEPPLDTASPPPDRELSGQSLTPTHQEVQGQYRLRFAHTEADLDAVCRLRFRVFNLELGEGLEESHLTGRDEDAFDRQCQHVIVEHVPSGIAVGTYRLQVAESALAGSGFYSAGEFDLSTLPDEVLVSSIELGRACVEKDHRTKRVLYLLWRGLAEYVVHNERRAFFGCSSITSQDPAEGLRLHRQLVEDRRVHPELHVEPLPALRCEPPPEGIEGPVVEIPTLFGIYLRHGAWILGPPALDRQFGTIDYLTYLEVRPDHLEVFGRR